MDPNSLIFIFLNAALINNFVLALFLGLCPFLGVSAKKENRLEHGAGHHVRYAGELGLCLRYQLVADRTRDRVSAPDLLHRGYRIGGSAGGDDGEEVQPQPVGRWVFSCP